MGAWISQHVVPEEHDKPPLWLVRRSHPRRRVIDILVTWLQTERILEVANRQERHWIRFAEELLVLKFFCCCNRTVEMRTLHMLLISENYYRQQQSLPYHLRRLSPRHSVPRLQWHIRQLRQLLKNWRITLEKEIFHSRLVRSGPRMVRTMHIDVPQWLLDEFSEDP